MTRMLRPSVTKRIAFFVLADILVSVLSFYLAYELRFNFEVAQRYYAVFWQAFTFLILFKVVAIALFKGYLIVWRFFGFEDAKRMMYAHLAAYGAFALFYVALASSWMVPFPRSVIGIDFFLSLILLGSLRSAKRFMIDGGNDRNDRTALVFGATAKAAGIIRSAKEHEVPYRVVAIIASEREQGLIGNYINSVPVFAQKEMVDVISRYEADVLIIAASLPQEELKSLVELVSQAGVRDIKRVRLLGSKDEALEELSIEDLLARHPKDLDIGTIGSFISGKRVLITGAGGSIGSEIARQCRRFGASALALIDHSEYNLYRIGEELPDAELDMLSVTDKVLLKERIEQFCPQIVIHAAAYKHVPLCEANKEAAMLNNVLGTKNVVDVCVANSVEKLVIISTDKAVRPTNVMGATKRVTELYAGNVKSNGTEIVAVRFGNVLGSSGSVIPKFKKQIENGGPVTVTHPEMTRYFMLIPEACQLVLQAAAIAKGGELFILDMGEPVKIVDLARTMIRLYGKENEVDITFSGLRPGEKLYEELLIDDSEKKTQYSSIFIAGKTDYSIVELEKDIEELLETDDIVSALKQIVPEFGHRP